MAKKETKQWERQRGESQKAFAAFCGYRDLGPNRSLARLGRITGAKPSYVKWLAVWSSKWRWVARAEAWDDEQDRIRLEATADEVRAQARRHADLSDRLVELAVRVLDRYNELELDSLEPKDLARIVDVGVKVGLLARGQPTSRTAADVRSDVSVRSRPLEDMTDEELQQLLMEASEE